MRYEPFDGRDAAQGRAVTILHLTTYLQGGAGRCVVDLASAQQAAGIRVIVVTSAVGRDGYENYPEYVRELRQAGVAVYLIDSLFTRDQERHLVVAEALSRLLPPGDVSLVHAHAATPALIGLLFASRAPRPTPVVQTMHGWGHRKSPAQATRDVAVMRLLDAIITTSESSARQLIDLGLAAGMIDVIPCGLAADLPAPVSDDASTELRDARGRGMRTVLCVGSVTSNKNQRLLVEALPEIGQPALCAFVGEGDSADLEERSRELHVADRVRFFGHRPNAAAYLADTDLLVLPSRSEGQGLVVLEAFRAGVLVVASDAPALQEIVSEPDFGFVFRSDSISGLAAAVDRALAITESQRQEIAIRARRRFMRTFSIEAMHGAHLTRYGSVLANREARAALSLTA